jgi:G2/mitotic-specific cyclin 2
LPETKPQRGSSLLPAQPYQSDVVEPGTGQSTFLSRALYLLCISLLSIVLKQPRRGARTTRSAKDTENANARQTSRLITRTKPTSTTTAPNKVTSTATTRAKTVLTDAKPDAAPPAKRKRAALGEIAGPSNQNQKEKPAGKRTTKDKPKEKFDGVVLKKSTVTTTTTTSTIRQPLKAVTGIVPQSRKAVISVSEQVQQLEQIHEGVLASGEQMAIDPPHRAKAEVLETKSLRVVSSRKQLKPVDEVDEEESRRVVKKRRTSSDLPEEAEIVAHVPPDEIEDPVVHPKRSTTPEAEPEGDQWDDLDAEDADDPLMVSEYVNEIFVYLKEVEVSEPSVTSLLSLILRF